MNIAQRRILRLALGTALSLAFSQLVLWPLSYLSALFTMFLLAVPLPAPTLKKGIMIVLILMLTIYGSMLLLPLLEHARWVGILFLIPILYGCFYFVARGGSEILGMFMIIGITLVVTVGSVSIDGLLAAASGVSVDAVVGLVFVWIAHALLPDKQLKPQLPSTKDSVESAENSAQINAFRSLVVVLPIVFILLFSSSSASYIAVMIKVASMGQQSNKSESRALGRSLLESTIYGGLAAMLAWQLLSIWPSLLLYSLIIALAGLIFGRYIFAGAGRHEKAEVATYAFLTMIIILAPSLLDGMAGSDVNSSFYTRLIMFLGIAIYGSVAVTVFDAFCPLRRSPRPGPVTIN